MGKRLIIILCILATFVAISNAQVFVGGSFLMNMNDGKSTWTASEQTSSGFGFNISPQVGYYLNDGLSVGIYGNLGYSRFDGKNTYTDDTTIDREIKAISDNWGLSFFVRKRVLGIKDFSLLVESTVGAYRTNSKRTENEVTTTIPETTFGVNAQPVLSYKLSDKLDMLAYCNFLTIGYNCLIQERSDNNFKYKTHSFNFAFNSFSNIDILSNWNIGFIYKFR